ncbi:MAG: GNAT family N-acetyltransferase [Pyrinomonadaceae bacterium]
MTLAVRRAVPEDARKIAEFALKLFAQHRGYAPERFVDLANAEGAERYYGLRTTAAEAIVLIAEKGEETIGFLYGEFERFDYAELLEAAFWVHDLYVAADSRGIGAGSALVEAAKNAAIELGVNKIVLMTAAKNGHAREFFTRGGFRETMIEVTLNLDQ